MALIRSDGFDLYDSTTEMMQAGWSVSDTAQTAFHATDGRYGGGCIKGLSSAHFAYLPFTMLGGNTLYACFAYKHDGGVAGTTDMLSFYTQEGNLVGRIRYTETGTVTAENQAGSTSSSVSTPLTANTWHWVEVKFTMGTDGVTGEMDVKINGSLVVDFNTTDTFQASVDVLTTLRFGGNNGTWWVDDVVVMDTTGSYMNGYLGDTRIDVLTVQSDGGVVDWTRSTGSDDYAMVDESPSNEATDYVYSSTAGQETRFNMSDFSVEPNDIWAVVVRTKMAKSDAGDRTWRALVNRSGTEATGTTKGLQTDYVWHGMEGCAFYVDPSTSAQWDTTGINAMQAGAEIVA